MKRWTRCFLLLSVFLFCFTGCGVLEEIGITTDAFGNERSEEKENSSGLPTGYFEAESHGHFAYDRLTDAEKIWYRDINGLISSANTEGMKLSTSGLEQGLTQDDIDRIYQSVLQDHPEYFFVEGYEYVVYSADDEVVIIEIKMTTSLTVEEMKERKEEIEVAAEQWLADAPKDGSDYEKIKYVYETIIFNTEYNMNASDNQNIYSVFCGQASVCQGYAKATQYLLQELGVECTLVLGSVNGGEGHSWNLVLADGEYYFVDTTWGDASYFSADGALEYGQRPDISYDYLCVTSEQLFKTHEAKTASDLPHCYAEENNYYRREGCFFTTYDEALLESIIQKYYDVGEDFVSLKCADESVYVEMYGKLIEEQEIFAFLSEDYSTIAYIENEQQLTLTFWMTNE